MSEDEDDEIETMCCWPRFDVSHNDALFGRNNEAVPFSNPSTTHRHVIVELPRGTRAFTSLTYAVAASPFCRRLSEPAIVVAAASNNSATWTPRRAPRPRQLENARAQTNERRVISRDRHDAFSVSRPSLNFGMRQLKGRTVRPVGTHYVFERKRRRDSFDADPSGTPDDAAAKRASAPAETEQREAGVGKRGCSASPRPYLVVKAPTNTPTAPAPTSRAPSQAPRRRRRRKDSRPPARVLRSRNTPHHLLRVS